MRCVCHPGLEYRFGFRSGIGIGVLVPTPRNRKTLGSKGKKWVWYIFFHVPLDATHTCVSTTKNEERQPKESSPVKRAPHSPVDFVEFG